MARETCPVATPEPLQEPLIDPMDPSVEEDAVADTGDKYEFQEPPRKLWSGNTNVWMAAGSLYIIWFVLQRGTWRFTLPISTLGGTHVICASLFAIICCMNVFHTPSHGPAYRHVHIWLGRAAMLIGVVSVVTGMIVLYSNGEHSIWLELLCLAIVAYFGFQTGKSSCDLFKQYRLQLTAKQSLCSGFFVKGLSYYLKRLE